MEVDAVTLWGSAASFGLAGLFHLLHKANGKELRYLQSVTPIYNFKDLIALAGAGDLPAAVAVRGTVHSEQADWCDLQPDFKAVIKQIIQMHHRLKFHQNRWVPDEPIVARKPYESVPFSLMDEDMTCLPIRLHRDDDVEDALILAGSCVKPDMQDYMKAAVRAEGGSYTYSQEIQENVLTPGMEITAIGRVSVRKPQSSWQLKGSIVSGEGTLMLVNPLGCPVKLSRRTLKLLIEDVQKACSTCKFLAQACAVIGAVFIADQMARSAWAALQDARRRRNEMGFREAHAAELPGPGEAPRCVNCWARPSEMYFRGCGHAVVCLECSKTLKRRCPMCRTKSDCLPLLF